MTKKTAVQLASQQLSSAYKNITYAAHSTTQQDEATRLYCLASWIERCRYDADKIETEQRRRFGKGAK